MYKAKIIVTLQKTILDPQGKAVHHALENLGLNSVRDVRIGKYIEMLIESNHDEEAKRITEESCKKLLSNPVMEDYFFAIEKV